MSVLEIVLAVLAGTLALALLRQRWHLRNLERWIAMSRSADPPEADGTWGRAFDLLYRDRRVRLREHWRFARLIVRSRRAAQALPFGVAVLTGAGRLDWCNAAAQRHLGIDAERDHSAPIVNFVRQPEFAAWMAAGGGAQQLLHRGEMLLAVQRVEVEEGASLLLSRDVTEEARVETIRRDFVANVSHELRTPLTVLAGYFETIRDLDLDAVRIRDYVNLMIPYAERMTRIVEDLLTLSMLEHAGPKEAGRVAIAPLLARVRGEAERLSAGRHRITLEIESDGDLAGAEAELASAFLNLVANAVRYTPQGGSIRLAWRADASGAEFAVEDTGIGIAAEHLPRLTERFYRVDRARSREGGGTGLGLAIVKHALARHDATLDVRSTPGRGSRFAARFPATRLQVSAHPAGEDIRAS